MNIKWEISRKMMFFNLSSFGPDSNLDIYLKLLKIAVNHQHFIIELGIGI